MIRCVLVDDQALIRAGFRALLDAEDDIEVVGEAADGTTGVEQVRRHVPDVVLLDISMPGITGITVTERIAADNDLSSVHVVILTNYGLDEHVYDALRAGATGFLVKDTEPEDLIAAVRTAARGDALLSPIITLRLIQEFVAHPPHPPGIEGLTARESEVVQLVGQGLNNEEIAERMVITPMTAKTHVSRAMTKVGARDRAQLVVVAYESGLVVPRTEA